MCHVLSKESESSYHALQHAVDVSKPIDEIYVLAVCPHDREEKKYEEEVTAAVEQKLKVWGSLADHSRHVHCQNQFLCSYSWVSQELKAKQKVTYYFEPHSPAGPALCQKAKQLAVDYLVVGSRGVSGVKKLL